MLAIRKHCDRSKALMHSLVDWTRLRNLQAWDCISRNFQKKSKERKNEKKEKTTAVGQRQKVCEAHQEGTGGKRGGAWNDAFPQVVKHQTTDPSSENIKQDKHQNKVAPIDMWYLNYRKSVIKNLKRSQRLESGRVLPVVTER